MVEKKKEKERITHLVELSYKNDPRIIAEEARIKKEREEERKRRIEEKLKEKQEEEEINMMDKRLIESIERESKRP